MTIIEAKNHIATSIQIPISTKSNTMNLKKIYNQYPYINLVPDMINDFNNQ